MRINKEDINLYELFDMYQIHELDKLFEEASTREEKLFYHAILELKMGLVQERIVGKELL